jgi:hypothetical protein
MHANMGSKKIIIIVINVRCAETGNKKTTFIAINAIHAIKVN